MTLDAKAAMLMQWLAPNEESTQARVYEAQCGTVFVRWHPEKRSVTCVLGGHKVQITIPDLLASFGVKQVENFEVIEEENQDLIVRFTKSEVKQQVNMSEIFTELFRNVSPDAFTFCFVIAANSTLETPETLFFVKRGSTVLVKRQGQDVSVVPGGESSSPLALTALLTNYQQKNDLLRVVRVDWKYTLAGPVFVFQNKGSSLCQVSLGDIIGDVFSA